jgi:hypothetical protein
VTLWVVYFWIGILPHKIRASHEQGGATLLAYLPKATIPSGMRADELANFRCQLYHDCFEELLSSIKKTSMIGDVFQIGELELRHCTTVVSLKIADYPEM